MLLAISCNRLLAMAILLTLLGTHSHQAVAENHRLPLSFIDAKECSQSPGIGELENRMHTIDIVHNINRVLASLPHLVSGSGPPLTKSFHNALLCFRGVVWPFHFALLWPTEMEALEGVYVIKRLHNFT